MPDTSPKSPTASPTPQKRTALRHLGIDLRPGEGGLCLLLFSMHFLVLAFQYTAKTVRQSTYVDVLGAEQLPYVYLLIPILSYPVLRLYDRLTDVFSPRRLIALTSLTVAASMGFFWWLFEVEARWASVALYIWIAIVGILQVSQFWTYSSQLVDPRQARRLFGFLGAGGILGSIAGGQIASWTGHLASTRSALLISAILLVGLTVLVLTRGRATPTPRKDDPKRAPPESLHDARDGWSVVRRSPYLGRVALLVLLGAMVAQVIDLQFSWAIEASTDGLDERTIVFGNVYSVMGLAAFIFQILVTSRIHRRLGVGFALRVLPLTNGVTTLLFAAAAFAAPALVLPMAWLLKIGENGLRYSLDQSSRELLFQAVPPADRARAKAFIDVFVQRLAKGLSAVLLLTVTFGWVSPVGAAWVSGILIVVWLGTITAAQRRYVGSFREALLQSGLEADQEIDLSDVRTLEVLVEGMASSDSREVLHSLELLADHDRGHLVSPMLLYHPDPAVRCKTLQILRSEERSDTAPMVEKLLVDPDSTVRATATLALVALTPQDIGRLMLDRLRDPDVRVRGVAVSYLAAQRDDDLREHAEVALAEMLQDGSPTVRREAARALGAMDDPHHQGRLVQLLYDVDPQVVRSAIGAVERRTGGGGHNPLYAPILISHLHNRRLKHDARGALVAYGEGVIPALQHFLNDHQEEIWVRRALPKTIAEIGGPSALRALVDTLAALERGDLFLRRKVIEALETLRSRDPSFAIEHHVIEDLLLAESRSYLRALTDLWSLRGARELRFVGPSVRWPEGKEGVHLLERLLADRMDDHVTNLMSLLGLIHPPREMRAAHRGLLSLHATSRAHALEFLDNLLTGETRRLVFAVIDDLPSAERMREARRLFGLEPAAASSTLRRLAGPPAVGDEDGAWLTAAALHFIHDRRLKNLYPVIRTAAKKDQTALVQETTGLLLSRM